MPIYEYKCAKCGHEFEKLLKIAREKVNCPRCGTSEIDRKLSLFSAGAPAPEKGCGMKDECPSAGGPACARKTCSGW